MTRDKWEGGSISKDKMPTLDFANVSPGYCALVEAAGVVDLTGRTQLELTGDDRASFLHNFCTNNVRNLTPGSGTEAFVLDTKGHVLGHVFVFAGPSSIIIDTVAGQSDRLSKHLDRYIIRENVEIHDRSDAWGALLVGGPRAGACWNRSPCMSRMSDWHTPSRPYWAIRHTCGAVDLIGSDSWLLVCGRGELAPVQAALANAGAVTANLEAFELARIEAGTPLYGRDISDANLPQEVNRDAQAISFTKGCYLGQETVARIDAVGHVNRVLVGVRFAGPGVPAVGTELQLADQAGQQGSSPVVGAVTSAAYSPRLQSGLGLAYIRRGHTHAGTKLMSNLGPAEVVALPL